MTTRLIRERAAEIHSVGLIDHAKDSEMPRWEGALNRLISKLLRAVNEETCSHFPHPMYRVFH